MIAGTLPENEGNVVSPATFPVIALWANNWLCFFVDWYWRNEQSSVGLL